MKGIIPIYPLETVAPFAGAWIEIVNVVSVVPAGPSLPLRERGLKYKKEKKEVKIRPSLPLRERGLKSVNEAGHMRGHWSLPLRERGLKYTTYSTGISDQTVAPFAGAWIEILKQPSISSTSHWSLPLRERGLKC